VRVDGDLVEDLFDGVVDVPALFVQCV